MRYTQNINLPIVEDNDLYSKEINNLAFEKIDEEIQGLADIVETLDSPENSIADVKKDINDINEQLDTMANNIPYLNILNFGASEELEDNCNIINNIIDKLSSIGGGNVIIPKGTFNTSAILLKDNVNIIGVGKESVLKNKYSATNWRHVIYVNQSNNNKIYNLTLDGNYSGNYSDEIQQSHCIAIDRSNNLIIENCTLQNSSGDGIWIADNTCNSKLPENILINNCVFKDNKRQNISIVHGKNIKITNCTGNGRLDVEVEPHTEVTENIFISNNVFDLCSIMNSTTNDAHLICLSNRFKETLIWKVSEFNFSDNIIDGKLRTYCIKNANISNNTMACLDLTGTDSKLNININIYNNKIINDTKKINAVDGTGSEKKTVLIWGCKDLTFSNNEIKCSDIFDGINIVTNNENINIENNNIVSTNTDDTIVSKGVNIVTNSNKNITVKNNKLINFQNGVYATGASNIDVFKLINNAISSYSFPLDLKMIQNSIIDGNEIVAPKKLSLVYFTNTKIINNLISLSITGNILDLYNSDTIEIVNNNYECPNGTTMTFYNSPNIFIDEQLKNLTISPSGTTSFLSHSKYYNNKSIEYLGKIFINDVWSNINL